MAHTSGMAHKSGTARKPETVLRIIDAAFGLAADKGWRNVSLADVAAAAEISLAELHEKISCKAAIVEALADHVDRQVLAAGPADPDQPVRDRLFEVLMRRFDALAPYKAGLAAMLRDAGRDPALVLAAAPRALRAMAWMLEAAGVPSHGLSGAVKAQGLAMVFAAAVRVWLDDDSPDQARTMAALDKGLRRAEDVVRWIRRPAARPAPAPEAPPLTEVPA